MAFYDLRPANPFDQPLNKADSPTFSGLDLRVGESHLGSWNSTELRVKTHLTAYKNSCSLEISNASQFEVSSTDGSPAFISYLRGGFYGAHFGLDEENYFSTEGFSAGTAPSGVQNYTSLKVGNIVSLAGSNTLERAYQGLGLYTSAGASPEYPDLQVPTLKADTWTNSIHFVINGSFFGYVSSGGFVSVSDYYRKDVIDDTLDFLDILEKINLLPVDLWAFKHSPNEHHIGTYAQAFHLAFQLNDSEENPVKASKTISALDLGGVCLAGIKGLIQKFEQQEQEITALKSAVKELLAKMD